MSQYIQEAIDLIDTLMSSQSTDTATSRHSKPQPKDPGACHAPVALVASYLSHQQAS